MNSTNSRIDLQRGEPAGFDVFVNRDHYQHAETLAEAWEVIARAMVQAAGVDLHDYTKVRLHNSIEAIRDEVAAVDAEMGRD